MSLLSALHRTDLMKAPQVIMLRLYTADCSGATPAEIAKSTGLPKSTISMALDQLEKMRIIDRRVPARDRRVNNIYLTDEGREDTEKMLKAMTAYVEDVKNREGRVHP